MSDTNTTKPAHKRVRKMAREPEGNSPPHQTQTPTLPPPTEKPKSKATLVLELLRRPEGATLDDLVSATGWLPHTTRAALTGLRKNGHDLTSEKADGVRRYRIAGAKVADGDAQ